MPEIQSVLLTGAAGLIGARVGGLLLESGINVVAIDNLNDYYDARLKTHRLEPLRGRDDFLFHEVDIEDLDALTVLFEQHRFDAVVNLAARAGVRASVANPHVYLSTNAHGALNILELMRHHEVPKCVLASTSSLYAGQPMPFVESAPVNEPISPYAASKKAAEVMSYTYHSLFEIDVSIVRYFTVYGPAGRPDMAPYRFINWISRGEPIQLFGDGSQRRDFTYVDDIARGTVAALKPVGYEVINLGSSKPHSVLELIQEIERAVGRSAEIEFLPEQATDMNATWANTEKAKRLLGWEAKVSLSEGIQQTWDWHREHSALLSELHPREVERS